MVNLSLKTGPNQGQSIASITDKSLLIQYRSTHSPKGDELLAINARIRELHKRTNA